MRLQYTLKFGDYLLFNAAHQFLSVPLQVTYLAFAWLLYAMSIEENGRLVAAVAGVVLYLGMWLFQMAFNVAYLYSSKNRSLLTTHTIEIQENSFYEETPFNKSYNFWPGIAKVVKRPGFAAVYISANAAHIIPRRAFASDEEMARFVAMVRERMHKSRDEKSA